MGYDKKSYPLKHMIHQCYNYLEACQEGFRCSYCGRKYRKQDLELSKLDKADLDSRGDKVFTMFGIPTYGRRVFFGKRRSAPIGDDMNIYKKDKEDE